MDMGKKIHDLRVQKGLTLEQLGDKVGVGKSTVRKWENGIIANMKRDKIVKLSIALDTTPGYLMGWEDSPDKKISSHSTQNIHLSDEEKELLEIFHKLNPDGKKKLFERAEELLSLGYEEKEIKMGKMA